MDHKLFARVLTGTFLVAVIGSAAIFSAEPPQSTSLPNPGFEAGEGEEPGDQIPGWSVLSGADKIRRSSELVRTGKYSLRLDDDSNQAAVGLRSEPIAVQPGVVYHASVWALVKKGTAQLYLEFWDDKGNRIDVVFTGISQSNDWKQISLSRAAPENAKTATVLLYGHKSNVGLAYYDDVEFSPEAKASNMLALTSLPLFATLAPPLLKWPRRPAAAEIIQQGFLLKVAGHPRLYFTQEELPALRAKINDRDNAFGISFQEAFATLLDTARAYLNEQDFTVSYYGGYQVTYPLPPRQPDPRPDPPGYVAGRYPYWTAMAGQLKSRLETLALAYVFTGDERYAGRAKEYLLSMTTWDVWSDPTYNCGGQTCLDTGYIVEGVALAYDVLYEHLSNEERSRVRQALVTKGLQPLYSDTDRKIDHNIHMVRTAALGLGALALLGEEPDMEKFIARAFDNFFWYLDQRLDSGQTEGMLYTNVSMEHITSFAGALERVTGNRSMFEHPYVKEVLPRWVLYFLGPAGSGLVNFSDSSIAAYFFTTMAAIGRVNQNARANWYIAASRAGGGSGYLLHLDPKAPVAPPDGWPSSAVFADIGWVAMRSGWGPDDTLLAFQASGSSLGHNHLDQNHFVLNVGGQWLIKDPGYQDYNPGPKNLMTYHTLGHNAVIVNGRGQTTKGGGQLVATFTSRSLDYAAGEASRAYTGTPLQRWVRHILYVKPDYFVFLDELLLEKETDQPELLLHPDGIVTVEGSQVSPGFERSANHFEIRRGSAAVAGQLIWPRQNRIALKVTENAEEYGPYLSIQPAVAGRRVYVLSILDPYTETEIARAGGTYPAGSLLPAVEDSGRPLILTGDGVFFKAEGPGDRLTLRLELPRAGRYEVQVSLSTAPGYGRIAVDLDGKRIGPEIDTYSESLGSTGAVSLGEVDLPAGAHEITFTVTGKHERATHHFVAVESIHLAALDEHGKQAGTPFLQAVASGATKLSPQRIVTGVDANERRIRLNVAGPDSVDHVWIGLVAQPAGTRDGRAGSQTAAGNQENSLEDLMTDGFHAVVSVGPDNEVWRYALVAGTFLSLNGRQLLASEGEVSAAIAKQKDGTWVAEINAEKEGVVKLWLPGELAGIRRDGGDLSMSTVKSSTKDGWTAVPVTPGANTFELLVAQ